MSFSVWISILEMYSKTEKNLKLLKAFLPTLLTIIETFDSTFYHPDQKKKYFDCECKLIHPRWKVIWQYLSMYKNT